MAGRASSGEGVSEGRGCARAYAVRAGIQARPAFQDEARRAEAGVQEAAAPRYGTTAGAAPSLTAPKDPAQPAEPHAEICRCHVGVVPVTLHNARYSGIGGV